MEMLEHIAEYVDRLVNVKLTPMMRTHDAHTFYGLARAAQDDRPLTFLAADLLLRSVGEGDRVLILHNAGVDPWLPRGETDGPLGAASLARVLVWALRARPVFVAESRHREVIEATATVAGLLISPHQAVERANLGRPAEVDDFPLGPQEAHSTAVRMLDLYQPKAVIAVERIAPNPLGLFHSGAGWPLDEDGQAHVHILVDEARRRGIATIGIGDGGNEIGYGLIRDGVNAWKREALGGVSCRCGCGAGGATRVETDVLVSAATSNWGAYGVGALLAIHAKDAESLQDEETEWRMLDACVRAGAVDAGTGGPTLGVDGTSARASRALVALLQELITNSLRGHRSRLFPPNMAELNPRRS